MASKKVEKKKRLTNTETDKWIELSIDNEGKPAAYRLCVKKLQLKYRLNKADGFNAITGEIFLGNKPSGKFMSVKDRVEMVEKEDEAQIATDEYKVFMAGIQKKYKVPHFAGIDANFDLVWQGQPDAPAPACEVPRAAPTPAQKKSARKSRLKAVKGGAK